MDATRFVIRLIVTTGRVVLGSFIYLVVVTLLRYMHTICAFAKTLNPERNPQPCSSLPEAVAHFRCGSIPRCSFCSCSFLLLNTAGCRHCALITGYAGNTRNVIINTPVPPD